jgi:hypothetical protein
MDNNTMAIFINRLSFSVGIRVVSQAPIITKTTAGIPNFRAISLLIPFLNKTILERLLKT